VPTLAGEDHGNATIVTDEECQSKLEVLVKATIQKAKEDEKVD